MPNTLRLVFALALAAAVTGCKQPLVPFNPTPPQSEAEVLADPLQLTRGFHRAGEAYFSPDMKWIVFQASIKPDEDYAMYLAQLKYQGDRITGLHTPVRISPAPSWNSCGYFSPDGNSLIFSSTALKPQPKEAAGGYQRDKGSYRWAMPTGAEIFRADGWLGAIAAVPPGGAADLAKHPLTDNDDHDAECSYSPDGRWIVYASKVGDDILQPAGATQPTTLRNIELFAMRADGSKRVRLTDVPGYDGGPFFSPDGRRLVYRSDRKGNNLLQVFTADLVFDGNGDITGLANERQLTDDTNVNWGPYWHPDGKHIAWSTSVHGHSNYEVYLMRADGSRKTRLTFTNGADILPVFSPDGRYLMWTSVRGPEKSSQIWIAKFTMPKGT